jgi:hypothetical protein
MSIRPLFTLVCAAALASCSASPGDPVSSVSLAPSAAPRPRAEKAFTPSSPWSAMRLVKFDGASSLAISDDAGAFRPARMDGLRFLQWSPDAAALIAARADGGVVRCDAERLDASSCRELFKLPDLWRLAAAPDGARFLGVPSQGKEAWVFDASTGERRSTPAREGAWLDDHRIAYVPYPEKQMHVWDVLGDTDAVLGDPLAAAEMRDVVPSPDARWIAVVTRRPEAHPDGVIDSYYGVAIQDALTGAWFPGLESTQHQARPDAGSHGQAPVWSPDSTRLLYLDEGTLTLIEGKGPFQTRALPQKAHVVLGWLDAPRVAYLVIDHVDDAMVRTYGHGVIEQYSDVWIADVDTGIETPLTTGGALRGAAFARVPGPR